MSMLPGGTGSDLLDGGVGNDTLIGGGGHDRYFIDLASGRTTVNNLAADGEAGPTGDVDFGTGNTTDQLWFKQSGNDLEVDPLGTANRVTIADWYAADERAQVQAFVTTDGAWLDSQVAQLVSATAAYSRDNPGFDPATGTQMPDEASLQGAIAASWHS